MILTKENTGPVDTSALIEEKIGKGNAGELLMVVPTNRRARNLKKEFISRSPHKAASGLNIETLGTLTSKLLREIKPFRLLSEASATIFIKQSSAEVRLRYFSLYKEGIPFGTLDRVKNVISEYKRQGITPEVLRLQSGKLEFSEKKKALDIADIYEVYLKKCNALNAFETGDIYEHLNLAPLKEFVAFFRKIYPYVNLILIDGFNEFSFPEIDVIDRLTGVPNARLFLSFDYDSRNKMIFAHLDKCYTRLEELGFIKIDGKGSEAENDFRSITRTKLFGSKQPAQKFDFRNKVVKISATDKEKEIGLIAREIKELILNEGAAPHHICVAFNMIQGYSSIIKDLFEKNGLPFNLTDRTPLDNSGPVTAVVNFLEIIENNFYFRNIFRALSSGFTDPGDFDIANLYRVSAELKIVAGRENWNSVLYDALANLDFSGDSDSDETNLRRASYKKAMNDIKALSNLLEPFNRKLTIDKFVKTLKDFIVAIKMPGKLLESGDARESNIRAFTEFIETITEIFDLLQAEYGNEKEFPLAFYTGQIRTACGWARFNVKERSDYGVQVTSLDEIRGLNFEYLFIGGLKDGEFPTRFSPEIFFSGSFKKKASQHQTEERYRFYQSLCTWSKKLYLSYSAADRGQENVVSTFLTDFENLFEISGKNESNYENTIYSDEDLQIYAGKNGLAGIPDPGTGLDRKAISKSLAIEKIRTGNPFGDSQFTGHLLAGGFNGESSDASPLAEKLKLFSFNQYSISQLEIYAKCPFKYFAERLLGIEAIEDPTEEVEAVELGRILHAILYEFYASVRKEKIKIAGCGDADFREAEKLIFGIAERRIETALFKSPLTFYEKEKLLGIAGERKESVLYRFIEAEREGDGSFLPAYFEVGFGRLRNSESDEILSDSEPIKLDGAKLRGKIDRIEINEKLKSFNVVDYKLSGSKPSFNDLKNGISLQLPVYLYAAGELLKRKYGIDYSPNEIFIYSLKYSSDDFGKKPVKSKGGKGDEIQSVDQLIRKSIEYIGTYIGSISGGKFNLSTLEDRDAKVCRFCKLRTVCRIDDVKY